MKSLLSKIKSLKDNEKVRELCLTISASLVFVFLMIWLLYGAMVIAAKLLHFDNEYQRIECDACGAALPAENIQYCSACGADAEHLWLVKTNYCPECETLYFKDDIQFCTKDGTPVKDRRVRMDQASWYDILKLRLINP